MSPEGGVTEVVVQIERHARTLAGKSMVSVQDRLLESADNFAFDSADTLRVVDNERNTITTVTADGKVPEIAKHGSHGPFEFPSAIVYVGNTAYISNNATPPGDNMGPNGKSDFDGIGASVVQITP